ncbi:MAG: hypothetical protein ACTS4X_02200 [Candidatus Hodgkinia cicadicola]
MGHRALDNTHEDNIHKEDNLEKIMSREEWQDEDVDEDARWTKQHAGYTNPRLEWVANDAGYDANYRH